MNDKAALRKQALEILTQMPAHRQKEASFKACQTLCQLADSADLVASFAPFEGELDIWTFNQEMIQRGKLCLPVVSGKGLIFIKVNNINDLQRSKWNILEPPLNSPPQPVDQIDFVIVPGLLFDQSLHRLGRGRGYYDTFIATHRPEKTIGVGFYEQQAKKLPYEQQDQQLSQVLLF